MKYIIKYYHGENGIEDFPEVKQETILHNGEETIFNIYETDKLENLLEKVKTFMVCNEEKYPYPTLFLTKHWWTPR